MLSGECPWRLLAAYRPRMLALAVRQGAGPDAEDVVQEALLRAATFERLDQQRPWPFLAAVTARLVADHHRRAARDHALRRNVGLAAAPIAFEDDLADRHEAVHAARLLARVVPAEITEVVWRRAGGASWQQLAAEYQQTARALETRARRALLEVRRRILTARWDPPL